MLLKKTKITFKVQKHIKAIYCFLKLADFPTYTISIYKLPTVSIINTGINSVNIIVIIVKQLSSQTL